MPGNTDTVRAHVSTVRSKGRRREGETNEQQCPNWVAEGGESQLLPFNNDKKQTHIRQRRPGSSQYARNPARLDRKLDAQPSRRLLNPLNHVSLARIDHHCRPMPFRQFQTGGHKVNYDDRLDLEVDGCPEGPETDGAEAEDCDG
jgi:hypothetical protein